MNKLISYRRGLLLCAVGASLVALAACNSLTGINDLKVGAEPIGTAGTGGTGNAGTGGDAGAGNGPTAGAAGSVVDPPGGAKLGEACSANCEEGLVCIFGLCRTSCETDAGCPGAGAACLTDTTATPARGGCRFPTEKCATGGPAPTPPLVCGPGDDGFVRTACQSAQQCRQDQHCIQGSCIGPDEVGTAWGKCGDAGKTCVGKKLSLCDVGNVAGAATADCDSAALCSASITGDGRTCAACLPGEARCGVDGTSSAVSAEKCTANLTGFDADVCGGANPAQCNPTTAQCESIVVDAHEVTREEYAQFLVDVGTPTNTGNKKLFPAACGANNLTPDTACLAKPVVCKDPTACAKHPQVCVDWCDAFAYCASKGQHLCGKIGTGAMVPFDDFANPGVDEWTNACSVGGRFAFGLDLSSAGGFDALNDGPKCNARNGSDNTTAAVDDQRFANCGHKALGYEHERNLLGNVREWENSCKKTADAGGPDDLCHTRGASFAVKDAQNQDVKVTDIQCDKGLELSRSLTAPDLGFRCCGTPQ
jgi:formylglycine-generating enzyme